MAVPAAAEIVVVGSVNLDLVAAVPTLPKPGETVLASGYSEFPGGKGGNQAVAAARLGRAVAIVGRTGPDAAADLIRTTLRGEGVGVQELRALDDVSTGRALVLVDGRAENCIAVVAGANARLAPEHVDQAAALLQDAAVVVCQLEVPLETVHEAAKRTRGIFVLNPAPAQKLGEDLMRDVDVLVVNEGEFELVSGHGVPTDLSSLASSLPDLGLAQSVVVTLGSRGALVWHAHRLDVVPAPAVTVVDTTGAGDTFVGALADALARGQDLLPAAHWAVCAASLSTRRLGATSGMPSKEETAELLSAQHGSGPMARSHVRC